MKSARAMVVPLVVLACVAFGLDWAMHSFLPPARFIYRVAPATSYFLDFGAEYDTLGFSAPETVDGKSISWTWYNKPMLELPLIPLEDTVIEFSVASVITPDFWDEIHLSINGTPLDVQRSGMEYRAIAPRSALIEGRQKLEFQTPRAEHQNLVDPESLDWRVHGIAMDWVRIYPASEFYQRCTMTDSCVLSGFTDVQRGLPPTRWTVGVPTVVMRVVPGQPLTAAFQIAESISPRALDELRAEANGLPAELTVIRRPDSSGAAVFIDIPPQEGQTVEIVLHSGDSTLLPVGFDGAMTRVGLRVETVEIFARPQINYLYNFNGSQQTGLSPLTWQGDTAFQWMTAPTAHIELPSFNGAAHLEIGVLKAANPAQLDTLTVEVDGQPVTLTRRTVMEREVFSGKVNLDGRGSAGIDIHIAELAEIDGEALGLALDWIQMKPAS